MFAPMYDSIARCHEAGSRSGSLSLLSTSSGWKLASWDGGAARAESERVRTGSAEAWKKVGGPRRAAPWRPS